MKEKNWIIKKIKESGNRVTPVRKSIANALIKKRSIFSAKQILTSVDNVDKVSVYRTLDLLCLLDIIHSVGSIDGEIWYELHEKSHHHHAVCTSCKRTSCIPCDIPNMKQIKGFTHTHHSFLITGLCDHCAAT